MRDFTDPQYWLNFAAGSLLLPAFALAVVVALKLSGDALPSRVRTMHASVVPAPVAASVASSPGATASGQMGGPNPSYTYYTIADPPVFSDWRPFPPYSMIYRNGLLARCGYGHDYLISNDGTYFSLQGNAGDTITVVTFQPPFYPQ